ncbi:glutamate racemase [Desulfovibrio sp. OttesenSCG-928-C06]|nr:glutamate racemase [Desulfovibrio sp. OttesenSCG-928-C06]
MSNINQDDLSSFPIGVFDSGMGGLTVLSALMDRLPHENMLYLGDTARLPYGTKSPGTVSRYALQAAAKLVERKVKMLVIACNTATASALDDLRKAWPDLPIFGVVGPGAQAACTTTRNGSIAVIATESTIRGGAYQRAIKEINPDAAVTGHACSLFVPLTEEGWMDGPIVEAVARRYLGALFDCDGAALEPMDDGQHGGNRKCLVPDCLVLGCTHFPPLAPTIRKVLGNEVAIVDSAATTAGAVENELARLGLLNSQSGPGEAHFMTTDDEARFARIGSLFLGRELSPRQVELVNL